MGRCRVFRQVWARLGLGWQAVGGGGTGRETGRRSQVAPEFHSVGPVPAEWLDATSELTPRNKAAEILLWWFRRARRR